MDKNYQNEKTLNHEFFLSERHFMNYCLKVCKTLGIYNDFINYKNLNYFAWSLAHEVIFKRNGVKPPYAVLISVLKLTDNATELSLLFTDYLKELIALRYGNATLEKCPNIIKYEFYHESSFDIQVKGRGLSVKMERMAIQNQDNCGVYKLFNNDKDLIYIGKSYSIGKRIVSSAREQRASYVKIMITKTQSDANLIEQYLIATEKPSQNDLGMTFDELTVKVSFDYKFLPLVKIYK